ncbi:MAG: phosphatase PAP2 family protein, partial [Pseudoxanthomonas sp.]
DFPRPPAVASGFSFPSITITMATITFGFFAVLIARELPGRRRIWPYLVSGVVVALIGFARIYLGAHWLSDVVGGMLFGIFWLLVLGIAYRRRTVRSLWMKPLASLFYSAIAIAALWHCPRNIEPLLAQFEVVQIHDSVALESWWQQDWQRQPSRRNDFDDQQRWPLDVQVGGALAPLRSQLEAQGWRLQAQAGWEQALNLLDNDQPAQQQPVLPASLDTRAESLLMLREGTRAGELLALRLWAAPTHLQPGNVPLWIGSVQTLRHQRALQFIGMWRPLPEAGSSLQALSQDMGPLQHQFDLHHESQLPVLRIRTDR